MAWIITLNSKSALPDNSGIQIDVTMVDDSTSTVYDRVLRVGRTSDPVRAAKQAVQAEIARIEAIQTGLDGLPTDGSVFNIDTTTTPTQAELDKEAFITAHKQVVAAERAFNYGYITNSDFTTFKNTAKALWQPQYWEVVYEYK